MGLWSAIRDTLVASRKDDEALHAEVLREIETGTRRPGLWAKALAKAGGNEDRAKAEYIKLVVKDLRDQRYVVGRIEEEFHAQERKAEEQRQLEQAERQRTLAEYERIQEKQNRDLQLQRISDLKARARNWGFLGIIPSWFLGLVFFMGVLGDEFADSVVMSAMIFAPIGGFLVYLAAAAVKLSGEWRPDKENGWSWVWIVVGGIALWVWLANKEPETQAMLPSQSPQVQHNNKPETNAVEAKTTEQPSAQARTPATTPKPSESNSPRNSSPREPCVIKPVMTDEELRRCRER